MISALDTSHIPLAASEKPISIPVFRREKYVAGLLWCVMLIATIASITVCAVNGDDRHLGFDPIFDTALIAACVAGVLSVLTPIGLLMLCCESSARSEYQQLVNDDPRLAYRMNVARVLVAENARKVRKSTWQWFPWIDLLLPSPLYICILVIPEARLVLIIICAGLLFTFLAARSLCAIVQMYRIRNASAGDICFMCFPTKLEVAVLYAGHFTVMKCARYQGQRTTQCLMGRCQLVGHRQDPADEASPVVAWSLKMVYGKKKNDLDPWQTITTTFPVDLAKVSDFRDWLSAEPRKRMFEFSGATATTNHEIHAEGMPFQAFLRMAHREDEDDFQFGLHNIVLTARITENMQDRLTFSFTSMAGEEIVRLQVHISDTIADLCHMVAVHPRFVSTSVRIVSENGRALNNTDGMASVETLLEIC